ncbi:fatty acid desaturase, partial [Streptomyces sp. SID685]
FLTHNISIHTAHHVAPVIPYYNLPKAQETLKARYPGMVRERRFSFGQMWDIVRHLHFYDTESGYYADLARNKVEPKTAVPSAAKGAP